MYSDKIKPQKKSKAALHGSGIWFSARNEEWVVFRFKFSADLFKIEYCVNQLMLEKYASINIQPKNTDVEIIDALFLKVFPPRNNEMEESPNDR